MATTPPTNEAFLREVDEELRRDQMLTLWQRYGRIGVGAVIVALIALAGYLWWTSHSEAQAGVAGEQLSTALQDMADGNAAKAGTALDPLTTSNVDGVAAAALLAKAALAIDKGDTKGAAALYAQVAANTKLDQAYRDLALVRGTAIAFDAMKPEEVVARLKPLAIPGNAWFGSAGEMVGIAYMKMGKNDLAGATFAAIAKDETVPQSIRSRVVQLTGVLGVDALPAEKGKN